MALPSDASVVFTWIASALTVTVSVTSLTRSETLTVAGVLTCNSRFSTTTSAKPIAFAIRRYFPAGSARSYIVPSRRRPRFC